MGRNLIDLQTSFIWGQNKSDKMPRYEPVAENCIFLPIYLPTSRDLYVGTGPDHGYPLGLWADLEP